MKSVMELLHKILENQQQRPIENGNTMCIHVTILNFYTCVHSTETNLFVQENLLSSRKYYLVANNFHVF